MPSDALSEPTVGHDGTDEERVQRQAEEQHDIPANVVREGPSHETERPSPSSSHSARPSLGPSRSNSTPQNNVGPSDTVVERFAPTITVGTSNNERLLAPHKAEDQRTPCSKGSHAGSDVPNQDGAEKRKDSKRPSTDAGGPTDGDDSNNAVKSFDPNEPWKDAEEEDAD